MTDTARPFVSVIMPLYNDAEHLPACLEKLLDQTYEKRSYEIIVVDNGSTDDWSGARARFPGIIFGSETKPGSYAARNKGIALSRGEILAFIDSDCLPCRTWIEAGVSCLREGVRRGAVGGEVAILYKDPVRPSALELYQNVMSFPQKRFIEKHHFSVTANLFTFRSVVDSVGAFNDALRSSGDREWGNRVFNAGYELVYAEKVLVHHPARTSWGALYRQAVRLAGGFTAIEKREVRSLRSLFALMGRKVGLFFDDVSMALLSEKVQNWTGRVTVLCVLFSVKGVMLFERVRLLFGGKPRR